MQRPIPKPGSPAMTAGIEGGGGEPPDLDRLYTFADVTRLFRRSPRTIRNWVSQGRLTAVRVGPAVYFLRREIDRLISGREDE